MRFKLRSNLSLRYLTRGKGSVIVLLHPVGLRAEFWQPVMAELEDDFRLIAIDTRGHGDSDAPDRKFTLDDCANDVIELFTALGQPPVILVGCSMGGMIAQGVAVRAPQLLSGLVIANTGHQRNAHSRTIMTERAQNALSGMPNILTTTLSRWFDDAALKQDPTLSTRCAQWLLDADPVIHSWSWEAIRDLNYADSLVHFTRPMLGISGLRDQSTPVSAVKSMATAFPKGASIELDTGHLAPLENPPLFAKAIREFARQTSFSPGSPNRLRT